MVIKNMVFSDVPATAHVGDVIEWSNEDFVAHTATAGNHGFDAVIAPGKTGRTVLQHPGKVPFFCRFHPTMAGCRFHPTMAGEIDVAPALTSAAGDRKNR